MKSNTLIVFLLIILYSCTNDKKEYRREEYPTVKLKKVVDVAYKTFHSGDGLGGHIIKFIDSSSFYSFGWCDICSGTGSYGTYQPISRKLTLRDTLCFENQPHFTDKQSKIECSNMSNKLFYIIYGDGYIYLSENPSDTIKAPEHYLGLHKWKIYTLAL